MHTAACKYTNKWYTATGIDSNERNTASGWDTIASHGTAANCDIDIKRDTAASWGTATDTDIADVRPNKVPDTVGASDGEKLSFAILRRSSQVPNRAKWKFVP